MVHKPCTTRSSMSGWVSIKFGSKNNQQNGATTRQNCSQLSLLTHTLAKKYWGSQKMHHFFVVSAKLFSPTPINEVKEGTERLSIFICPHRQLSTTFKQVCLILPGWQYSHGHFKSPITAEISSTMVQKWLKLKRIDKARSSKPKNYQKCQNIPAAIQL